jgi:murein L,D-transpeptidase YcbB/YkuD
MADDNTTPTTDQQHPLTDGQQQTDATQNDEGDLGDAGKKAIEAERKARKAAEKQVRDLQKAQADAELAGKPEAERAQAAVNAANAERDAAFAERDAAQVELARYRAAAKYGLTDEDVEFLTGDPDEIDGQAKRLSARLGAAGQPRRPAPDQAQGGGQPPASLAGDGLAQALYSKLGITG